jgi:hypothetical protein
MRLDRLSGRLLRVLDHLLRRISCVQCYKEWRHFEQGEVAAVLADPGLSDTISGTHHSSQ